MRVMINEKDLFNYYITHIIACDTNAQKSLFNYYKTHDDEQFDDYLYWLQNRDEWERMAIEENIYLVY